MLAGRNHLFISLTSLSVLSIIGATQNRWDRLCCVIFVFSITWLIFFLSHVVPFSAHFDPFSRSWYDIVVLRDSLSYRITENGTDWLDRLSADQQGTTADGYDNRTDSQRRFQGVRRPDRH